MNRKMLRWLLAVPASALVLLITAAWRAPEVAAWQWRLHAGKPQMSSIAPVLAPGVRWFDRYFVVADLGHNAFAIGEPLYGQCNFSYLIVGTERALLFDTGPGVKDITPAVRSLTVLPVLAIPSHLHFDHVGNLARFSTIGLPDLPALRAQVHDGIFAFGFYQYLGFVEGFSPPSVHVSRWIASGSDIELGGRRVRLISVPGHTPDSVVLLDRDANRLFAGDFIYPSSIYAYLPGADLAAYSRSAGQVAQLLDDGSSVYGAHGCDRLPEVGVPVLNKADVLALGRATAVADDGSASSRGIYPREIAVNERMTLLAKYPWMRP